MIIEQPIGDSEPVRITIHVSQGPQLGHWLLEVCDDDKRSVVGTDEHFEEFWKSFPVRRRVDKDRCRAKWKKMNLDEKWAEISAHISEEQLHQWDKYAPMTTTYLNQKRWEAHAEEAQHFTPKGI